MEKVVYIDNSYPFILENVYDKIKNEPILGKQVNYIPELASIDSTKLGVSLVTLNGLTHHLGDWQDKFSIQSIAKVLALSLAYKIAGEKIWQRVGVEPSGTSFNSLIQLENDIGIPRNPLINSGALVICDILISELDDPINYLLSYVQFLCGSKVKYSENIANSEKQSGFINIALCNYIKSFGNIHNDPSVVLDFYFKLCSIEMNCHELTQAFLFLANNGKLQSGKPILTSLEAKRINAIMQTCGFYDESGEFAYKVGLPGKSGVGGGIVAVCPNKYTIAVWSPNLNKKGNSYKGLKLLEAFTSETLSSVF